jgi:hypothetical protein
MKMKKGLLTMLALLSMGSSAFAQGTVNVPTVTRKAGEVKEVSVVASRQGKVKIELANGTTYRDLQFDLTLPAGITVATEGGVVKDAAAQHTVAFNAVADNKVRFVVYNDGQDGAAEKFADGIVVEIPVEVAADFTGTQAAKLDNILTSDDSATSSIALADANFNFRAMLLGDVNDDSSLSLRDATWIGKFLIDANPTPFVEEVGDVNDDAGISLRDATAIAKSLITDSSAKESIYEQVENNFVNDIDPE